MSAENIIKQTEAWLTTFIIKYNICPFARHEHKQSSIHYSVVESKTTEHCLKALFTECLLLDTNADFETTLIIYPNHFKQFDDYLDFLAMAESLLIKQGYEGVYQLASFHPHYCFEAENATDPANYTNRSPYPMLHLIREASLEHAVKSFPNPELIPERNIQLTRELGREKLQSLLSKIMSIEE